MYIQITTICNMSCPHCCMSCGTNYKGQHMTMDNFRKALALNNEYNSLIAIGGGEPTLHPKFKQIIYEAIEATDEWSDMPPWLATNGSNKELMYWLHGLMDPCWEDMEDIYWDEARKYNCILEWKEGSLVQVALSQDDYHDASMVDPLVLKLWKGHEIRSVNSDQVMNAGHCDFGHDDRCTCSDTQIKPNGDIFLCGCDDSPQIGTLDEGFWFNPYELEDPLECVAYITEENDFTPYLPKSVTNKEWVAKHQPVKRNKQNHPDSHRII